MKLLIAAGGDLNAKRDTGATPLFLAVQQNSSPELVHLLVKSGALPNTQTNVSLLLLLLLILLKKQKD